MTFIPSKHYARSDLAHLKYSLAKRGLSPQEIEERIKGLAETAKRNKESNTKKEVERP